MGTWTAAGARRARGVVLAIDLLALGLLLAPIPASPSEPLRAVASFSILGDLVRQVGGAGVRVVDLVGPDADAHGYSPAPGDSRTLAAADIVFVNGLGFEGWIDRLISASGVKAPVVVASRGVATIPGRDDHDHGGSGAASGGLQAADPHAWQSVSNVRIYVANIRDGLVRADPAHASNYARNADAYLGQLAALDAEIRETIAKIPPAHRRIITTHDAFGYFSAAYGLAFLAPQGVATDAEASPRDVGRIIRQIRSAKVPAVFLETIADPRLMQQIARESGAKIGGKVFSDALSRPDGPAASYLDLMRSNLRALSAALGPG